MDHEARILLVEDEALIRVVSVDFLEESGFEVLEASNAHEALDILVGGEEVELLLSDIDMPGEMDGFDLANLVSEKWPEIRLLLTSGKHEISEKVIPNRGRFLPKPFTSNQLIGCVTQLLTA